MSILLPAMTGHFGRTVSRSFHLVCAWSVTYARLYLSMFACFCLFCSFEDRVSYIEFFNLGSFGLIRAKQYLSGTYYCSRFIFWWGLEGSLPVCSALFPICCNIYKGLCILTDYISAVFSCFWDLKFFPCTFSLCYTHSSLFTACHFVSPIFPFLLILFIIFVYKEGLWL